MNEDEEAEKYVMAHASEAIKEQIPYFVFAKQMYLAATISKKKYIAELEKENAELRSIAEFQQGSNMDRPFKLGRAIRLIRNLLYVYQLGKNELAIARVREEAEQFLKEMR